jgi:hypothetical protein
MPAVLLLACVFALPACGGGDNGGSEDVDKLLNQAFRSEQNIDSGRLTLDATARLEGLPQLSGPVNVKMSGPFDGLESKIADTDEIPAADIDIAVAVAGQDIRAGFTSTGDKLFINFRGTDYAVPDGQFRRLKRQLERAQAEDERTQSPDLTTLGVRPNTWLKDATDEGTEEVGGAETTHIKGGVDVPKMLADFDRLLKRAGELNLSQQQLRQLPESIPDSAKKQITDSVEKAELDLYIGKDDKVLRKLDANIEFQVPENLRQQAGGLSKGEIAFSVQIADVNEPQTIEAPKSARPIRELQRALGTSGFGGLGGQSGSGSQGTSPQGGNAPSTRQSRRYLRCVQKAEGTAELNRCSDILR